ncbi:MAG TPA: DUF4058 family protein [Gemmataceae bacterium]|nr:DUF4058 family protein [Gemmataceae bacterium]
MPLLNHFVPPLVASHPWRSFHNAWAATIARQLNEGVLPPSFYAMPTSDFGGPVEIDVATLQEEAVDGKWAPADSGALWMPPAAAMTVAVEFPVLDLIEVQVFHDDGERRLTAAIELISPANKDRPATRKAFAVKCASYLNEGASVVVVDVVTGRRANLHAELVQLLDLDASAEWQSPTQLYANAYRTLAAAGDDSQIQIWHEPLTLGRQLAELPLWLGVDVAVKLDLEKSYMATCHDLRIRLAG